MALGKRTKIGIAVAVALIVAGAVTLVLMRARSTTIADAGPSELYIEEYGLVLPYDNAAGTLTYTYSDDGNGRTHVDIRNPKFRSTESGCKDKDAPTLIGTIVSSATPLTEDQGSELSIPTADGALSYVYPDSQSVSDACASDDMQDKISTQQTSVYRGFQDTVAQLDGSDDE